MGIKATQLHLDPYFGGTLQKQIQQLVSQGILAGRFPPGEKMPSSRMLAQQLGVSRVTVTLAYAELVAGDYLVSRGRSGHFISENAPHPPDYKLADTVRTETVDWDRALGARYTDDKDRLRPPDWRGYEFPFIYGQPDSGLFDHDNWRRCALEAHGRKDFEEVTADSYEQDDPKLVEYIVRNVLPRRGISARPEEVLLTLGAQNAIWICTQLLLTRNRTAVIENPCYPGLRKVLEHSSCRTVPVDVDENGLPPERLPDQVSVVFTTASHQCPTNTTMPMHRRLELLRLSSERNFIIVEDDYEFEMSFARQPIPALKSLDRTGSVVYIGSFSKSLFPGLRLGYIVASPAFIREARALRAMVLRHPPGSVQRTTAYFLSGGYHDSMLNRVGKAYGRRRAVMEKAISDCGLQIAGTGSFGGSSFWMQAPQGVDTADLAQTLRGRGVLIEPGRAFFDRAEGNTRFYRLAYSSIPSARIAEGIERIAAALA
tara:strand:+ start:622 stop:2079 length:1458 start_codon:yes stop_codon:yes gene_type:complete